MEPLAEIAHADRVVAAGSAIAASFSALFSRFHWTSLLSAALIAYGAWLWQRRDDPEIARKGFLEFLFPREVWLHRSALLDYRFVLFDKAALAIIVGIGALFIVPGGDRAVAELGRAAYSNAAQSDLEVAIAYTAAVLIVEDFCRYWAHRLMHTSPLLWQFHKVHHSVEVLTPVSQLRTHPVNGLVNLSRSAIAIPVTTIPFVMLFPGDLTLVTILGINAGRFAFDILGAQLRHSHVWLSFGPTISKFLISPAQHQIHHSRAPEHRDRNFGSQFAIWDWIFGTLYIPKRMEALQFGIAQRDMAALRTISALYLQPFRDARRHLSRSGIWPGSQPDGEPMSPVS